MARLPAPAPRERPLTVVQPRQPGLRARIVEFWVYRRLITYFARRFVEKRYSRTWLGWIWLPLRPALDVGSRVLLFGALLQVSTGSSVPYFVFYLIGASAWRFFDGAAYWATRSIELNRRVLRRVYIPRLIVMVAALAPTVTEYLIYGVITVIVLGYYVLTTGQLYLHFSPEMAFAPLGILLCGLMAISIGFWTAPYAAQARDVRFTLRYVLGFWLYLTPVIYPLSSVPRSYRTIAEYNPMTAPIQLVKLGVLGNTELPVGSILATVVFLCVVGFGGFVFFSRAESLALDSL